MSGKAPNILFLMSDQMGAPVLPIHGHSVCQAPHVEALADSGVVFVQRATGGEPYWAYKVREEDDRRFVRNAGAAPTKAKARFPYVEPVPFEQ